MAGLLLKLLPLLSMVIISASALMQVNIDCGASSPHTDENGIKWVADTSYINNGESHVVRNATTTSEEAMKTLRAFTSRRKNCYDIAIMKGGGQVLVRTRFNYGNYDGMSSPPTFDLMFDANSCGSVETSLEEEVYYEGVYYVAADDAISVCVGQSSALGGYPFVSGIQVWELDADMYQYYDKGSTALSLIKRVAFGASKDLRYPDDAYDRIWAAAKVPDTLTVLTSDATTIAPNNISERPPLKVLQTAVGTSDTSTFLTIYTDLPTAPVTVYINMYFAEPTKLGSGDTRSFSLFIDGQQVTDPQTLEYASALEVYVVNITASGSTQFWLKAAPGSTLPPIINALEVFGVVDGLSNSTDPADAPGLTALMSQFKVLQDWGGDPCLPTSYAWDWVGCSSDDSPRITALYLSGYGLSGELPDFSSLQALETVDMQNNSISGGIPKFLGSMPNLKELNLADNSLSGPIPSSIANNDRIKLTTSGNPKLCAAGQSCEMISTPSAPGSTTSTPSAPGSTTKRPRISSASKNRNSLELMLGLVISLAFFTNWF